MEENQQEKINARPEILPSPTYMPFLLAVSVTFVGWGLISTWLFFVVGLAGMGFALTGWIKELLYERGNEI